VWHGKGAISSERKAAANYAHVMAKAGGIEVSEFEQGGEDEMFWMVGLSS
jgi:hypothetical protein